MFGSDFYPTPRNIAHKMVEKISKDARYFLEPSAGRGDLATAITELRDTYTSRCKPKVDCIELDPNLAAILRHKNFSVVGDDWLTYPGVCYYDAIVMNPPFSNGDEHLLRAWEFMHDGEIVCLLNAETIRNPHTEARQRLAAIIREHGGTDELGPVFKAADRKTMVNVVLVYLRKVSDDDKADLWAKNPGEEKKPDADIGASSEDFMLAIRDELGNMEHHYNSANTQMLKAFEHLRKAAIYMEANGIAYLHEYERIPYLAFSNVNSARAEFAPKHRRDVWMRVFDKMQFRKWLDKKQTEEFLRDIERNGDIPFTAQNIKATLENVFMQRKRLFEQSCANVFDELTRYYAGNTTGTGGGGDYSGWKTNDSYKVNEKLIFPYGCTYSTYPAQYGQPRTGSFSLHYGSAIDIYNDLDRVLCVLDRKDFENIWTVGRILEERFSRMGYNVTDFDGNCESQYFRIRFFKKGTVHLWFKDLKLWELFNRTAAAGKRWLGENTRDGHAAPDDSENETETPNEPLPSLEEGEKELTLQSQDLTP